MYQRNGLTEIGIKILYSKVCFEAFCETKMKIRGFGLMLRIAKLKRYATLDKEIRNGSSS